MLPEVSLPSGWKSWIMAAENRGLCCCMISSKRAVSSGTEARGWGWGGERGPASSPTLQGVGAFHGTMISAVLSECPAVGGLWQRPGPCWRNRMRGWGSDIGRLSLCSLGSSVGRAPWTTGQGDDTQPDLASCSPSGTGGLWPAYPTAISVALGTKGPHQQKLTFRWFRRAGRAGRCTESTESVHGLLFFLATLCDPWHTSSSRCLEHEPPMA